MKKLFIIILVLFSAKSFCQDTTKVDQENVIDTITARDFFIHKYLLAFDISDYEKQFAKDSIEISEFFGKNINGYWWKSKGQYYWNPYEPLPAGVRWLYRKPPYEGFIEYLVNKYNR